MSAINNSSFLPGFLVVLMLSLAIDNWHEFHGFHGPIMDHDVDEHSTKNKTEEKEKDYLKILSEELEDQGKLLDELEAMVKKQIRFVETLKIQARILRDICIGKESSCFELSKMEASK